MTSSRPKIKVCHMASGDLWAGAEPHLAGLLHELAKLPQLSAHAMLVNDPFLIAYRADH